MHLEFKRQFLEMTVDKLLEQFVLSKYTGLEKPGEFSHYSYTNIRNELITKKHNEHNVPIERKLI